MTSICCLIPLTPAIPCSSLWWEQVTLPMAVGSTAVVACLPPIPALQLRRACAIHQTFQFAALAGDQQLRRRAIQPRSLQLTDRSTEFGDFAAQAQDIQSHRFVVHGGARVRHYRSRM